MSDEIHSSLASWVCPRVLKADAHALRRPIAVLGTLLAGQGGFLVPRVHSNRYEVKSRTQFLLAKWLLLKQKFSIPIGNQVFARASIKSLKKPSLFIMWKIPSYHVVIIHLKATEENIML